MKWKTLNRSPKYKIGDKREKIIFALWPRVCEDGKTRWLEKVSIIQELKQYCRLSYNVDDWSGERCIYYKWIQIGKAKQFSPVSTPKPPLKNDNFEVGGAL